MDRGKTVVTETLHKAAVGTLPEVLSEAEWQERADAHEAVVIPYIDAYRERRATRRSHPVHDFLFTYYQTNRQILKRWRPSAAMALQGAAAKAFLQEPEYLEDEYGVRLDLSKIDEGSARRLRWVDTVLRSAKSRPPRFNCFGLHEWAMVYKTQRIRHEQTPLRVTAGELERIVESSSIRCSHFDAFRFFTKDAVPLNELQPGRDDRDSFEQFGCVHFNMDLYRWSCKLSPWVGSDLIRDCFLLALEARELDMRASPYDLVEYGYEPIRIEEAAGRELYRCEQERIYREGQPLADRLLAECRHLLEYAE